MINIQSFTFNALQENTYLLFDETKACIVIDPGCYDREEQQEVTDFISANKLEIQFILNTHCHVDHVLGNFFLKQKYGVKLGIHKTEEAILRAVKVYAPTYGFMRYQETSADFFLEENTDIEFGASTLRIIFVPGHSPGHIAFYSDKQKFCIAGDVIFYRSIGRSDLPGGNHNTLIKSIKENILVLDDAVKIYPGHGPATTVGEERKYNPFLNGH